MKDKIVKESKNVVPKDKLLGTYATNSIVQADYRVAGNVPIPDAEDVFLAKKSVDENHK